MHIISYSFIKKTKQNTKLRHLMIDSPNFHRNELADTKMLKKTLLHTQKRLI